jgi:2-polyprenyl-6-methoxyphenol hydroxylase-like FAD-dependent oxidoreductase
MSSVTIIGAGPAGATAAILLARRGWGVTLIEQHKFPRDKGVRRVSQRARHRGPRASTAWRAALAKLGPVKLTKTRWSRLTVTDATVALPGAMWGCSRYAMDAGARARRRSAPARG